MTKICAWCHKEGKSGIIEIQPSGSVGQVTHGICHDHQVRLRKQYRRNLIRQVQPSPVRSFLSVFSRS